MKRWVLSFALYSRLQGIVVANCHRMPQSLFDKRLASSEDCARALGNAIVAWKQQVPDLEVGFSAASTCMACDEKHIHVM